MSLVVVIGHGTRAYRANILDPGPLKKFCSFKRRPLPSTLPAPFMMLAPRGRIRSSTPGATSSRRMRVVLLTKRSDSKGEVLNPAALSYRQRSVKKDHNRFQGAYIVH